MIDLTRCKNLIVLYPPGAGGNHLCNLLSTGKIFQPFFKSENYSLDLLKIYVNKSDDSVEHHFSKNSNLDRNNTFDSDQFINPEKINIIHGHLGGYFSTKHLLENLPGKYYITFGLSSSESIIGQRIFKFGDSHGANYIEQQYIYEANTLSRILDVDVNTVRTFPVDAFSHRSFDQIESFAKSMFGIQLPKECEQMHEIWFDRLLEFLVDKV